MKRKSHRAFLTLITLLLSPPSLAPASDTKAAPVKPNVLFIAVDDLRASLGCYGDTLVRSPNIDQFAGQSRIFTRSYCNQAVCGPSRASVLTGLLPDNTRVWHNRNLFRDTRPNAVTLPQHFIEHGYHAQSLGKVFSGNSREAEQDPQSWSVPPLLNAPGWSNYALPQSRSGGGKGVATEQADLGDDGYKDGKLAKLAIQTLEELGGKSQPFFLAVGFFKPHLPFNAPKKYWDLYDPGDFRPERLTSHTEGAPDCAYPDQLELGGYTDMPDDEKVDLDQAQRLRHGYYACVSYVDAQVGKLLASLKRLGLEDKTIVVLWSDHGFSLGEADHWCKKTNFEMDTRVPLIIRTPGMAEPGVPTEAMTEHVDLYPTVVELAGLPPRRGLDGISLAPVVRDPRRSGREVVLSQHSRPFKSRAPEVMGYSIRTDRRRYTRWVDWRTRETIAEELYDYTSDGSVSRVGPFDVERQNIIRDPAYSTVRDQLTRKMDEVLTERANPNANAPESKK
ncbi:MAG: sulfatase [Planctomycetota bacterium]